MALNDLNMNTATDQDTDDEFGDVKDELRTRFELLPDEIKKLITDDQYQTQLFNIAKEKKLTYDELGTLERETTMVLLGMTKPTDYRDELQVELKKNDAEVDALVASVNDQVFKPIRASLEKLYETKKEPGDFAAETAPLSSPADTSVPIKTETVNPIPTTPAPSLTSSEKNVLEKTGVILSDAPKVSSPAPTVGSLPGRDDLLKSIENPPKTQPMINIVADKLKNAAPAIPAVKTTDYTVQKPVTPAPSAATPMTAPASTPMSAPATPPGKDPYREPVE